MQKINEILDAKMQERYEGQEKRNYLGASMLGDECMRKVQLQYLGNRASVSAQTLRTFDIGTLLEDLVAKWLQIAGFDLKIRNEEGQQFGFSTSEGRIKGHIDGKIVDVSDDLKQFFLHFPILWENKTLNNKSFQETAKKGLMLTKPLYFSQVQLYMAYLQLEQCLFTALNKDSSELYFELIPFDSEAAQKYSDRAAQIIKASENNEAMPCISNDPSFFKCKMCGFRSICRNNEM